MKAFFYESGEKMEEDITGYLKYLMLNNPISIVYEDFGKIEYRNNLWYVTIDDHPEKTTCFSEFSNAADQLFRQKFLG